MAVRESGPKLANEYAARLASGLADRRILSERELVPELVKLAENLLFGKAHDTLNRIAAVCSEQRSTE